MMRTIEERNALAGRNHGLVRHIAKRYTGHGLDLDDLIGAGTIGLVESAESFDPSLGKAGSYLGAGVTNAIRHALRWEGRSIRLPSYFPNLMGRYIRAESRLRDELGRLPTFDEVCDDLGLKPRRRECLADAFRVVHAKIMPIHDEFDEDASPALDADLDAMSRALDGLDPRSRTVIEQRFGLDGSTPAKFAKIGRRLGLSRQTIREIERKALARLRELMPPRD